MTTRRGRAALVASVSFLCLCACVIVRAWVVVWQIVSGGRS